MRYKLLPSVLILCACALLIAAGCGSDDSSTNASPGCPEGQTENPITGACEVDTGQPQDAGSSDADSTDSSDTDATAGDSDTPPDGAVTPDATPSDGGQDSRADAPDDVSDDDAAPACPDRDNDGFEDIACGGTDCDDDDAAVYPGAPEVCSGKDNNCSGVVDEGLTCTFYAHSPSTLYDVNPFEKTATAVTSVPSNLFDIDTHPDGTLYGITSSALYEFDPSGDSWAQIGSLGSADNPNGLAIDNFGTAYITASNNLYTVDLSTGSATLVGSMGGGFVSSGDCVINKDNSLFMTSSHTVSQDTLVLIDGQTAQGQVVGPTGETQIYGLTAAWGRMFGVTGQGKLIEIDTGTGQSTAVHTFSGISFYGAASTPGR